MGAGSWGTALAIQFARSGHRTLLWGRLEDHLDRLAEDRENQQYLPGAPFPEALVIEPDIVAALAGAPNVLVSVPSHGFRAVLTMIRPNLRPDARLSWATSMAGCEIRRGATPGIQTSSGILVSSS